MWHISCATYAHMPAGVRAGDVHSNFDKRDGETGASVACRSCPGVRARRARRAAASVAPAVPAVTAAPAAPVAPAPHTGIPTRRVSRRDPPTSRFRRGPPERLLVDSGIQKCHGCVGDPRLTPKMRGSTHVPRADGDPQLSIGDPGTTFHLRGRRDALSTHGSRAVSPDARALCVRSARHTQRATARMLRSRTVRRTEGTSHEIAAHHLLLPLPVPPVSTRA